MTPFSRQPAPAFWAAKEEQWRKLGPDFGKKDPLNDWTHRNRSLGAWFHDHVRAPSEPRNCAYCDGSLEEQARETIDHFAPRSAFPELALAWQNLFPACDVCNEKHKGEQWSCQLIRPDTDPVDDWLDVDMTTGALRPSASISDPIIRGRVRLTIAVLGLSTDRRCNSRMRVIQAMRNAWKRDAATRERDAGSLDAYLTDGPYRFVARRFLDAVPPSAPSSRDNPSPPAR